jgi:hypothetical protein
MNYQRIYDEIINNAKPRGLSKKLLEGYFEKHHIIPKCMNGNNSKSNLVLLTAREHYICHWLLWKVNKENGSLLLAFNNMRCSNGRYKRTYNSLTSKQYDIIKSSLSAYQSRIKIGELNPMFGKTHTPEECLRISERNKGRVFTEEWKKKISEAKKGKKTGQIVWNKGLKTGHNPNNNSSRMLGKHHSEETKQKMRESQLKRNQLCK